MPKTRKAKKPRSSRKPAKRSEQLERQGRPSPFKSKYKRKKKVPV